MRQFIFLLFYLFSGMVYATPAFQLIALGVNGGVTDGNLSAYLVAPLNNNQYVSLDAGTLVNGLEKAIEKGSFHHFASTERDQTLINTILKKHIPVYLISHAHFDHTVGFVIAAPYLQEKQLLLARAETMKVLLKNVFNWSVWINSSNIGENPRLNFQRFQTLPLFRWVSLPNTDLQVKAFPLNHGNGYPSTAFLLKHQNDYLLYFGDTGADSIEHDNKIQHIWREIAPLIRRHQLHAILLECSYTNEQPNNQLFGHLKPELYLTELHKLAKQVNSHSTNALKGLIVFVTHIKPNLALPKDQTIKTILQELNKGNDLGIRFIVPKQGKRYSL